MMEHIDFPEPPNKKEFFYFEKIIDVEFKPLQYYLDPPVKKEIITEIINEEFKRVKFNEKHKRKNRLF